MIVLAVAMVAGGVAVGVRSLLDGGNDDGVAELRRVGSALVANSPQPLVIAGGPDTYEIAYRVRRAGAEESTEVVRVQRPFISRRLTTTKGKVTLEEEVMFGRLATRSAGSEAQVLPQPPVVADARPAAVVADATSADVLQRRELRQVAGQRCQVYRSGVGDDVLAPPRASDYVDTCVAASGLILERLTVRDGRISEQRLATRLRTDIPVSIDELSLLPAEPTIPINSGGGSILEADPASEPPGEFFVLESPDGFTLAGRYSVIPPQTALADPAAADNIVASTADVFIRGTEVLVLDRGATRGTVRPFEPNPNGRTADLGPVLGRGELLFSFRGPELRVALPGGRFVRLYGSVSKSQLEAAAAAVRSTPGGAGLRLTGPPSLSGRTG